MKKQQKASGAQKKRHKAQCKDCVDWLFQQLNTVGGYVGSHQLWSVWQNAFA